MPKQFISEMRNGSKVSGCFSVKYKTPVREYGKPLKGYMFSAGLSDRTGEIEMTFFGTLDREAAAKLHDGFDSGDIVLVEGYANEFNGRLRVNANPPEGTIRIAKGNEYDIGDFLVKTNQNVEEMLKKINDVRNNIKNPFLKALLGKFFDDERFTSAYKTSPAAMYMHHNCIGGLLEHNWGVVQFCETVLRIHPSLDGDLLLSAALLHDIGKVAEFETTSHIKVSEEGMLRGHSSIGEEMLVKKIGEIEGFPNLLKMKLIHMIIAHHGKKENGSAKEPQFPEAYALYAADVFDSKITQYIRVKKDAVTDDFRVYTKRLGEVYLR
jgi:3'-5' exoribonuclease